MVESLMEHHEKLPGSKTFLCSRGHQTPADPRHHHLRSHPCDGNTDGDSPLQESEGETLAGQGDGQLQRAGDLATAAWEQQGIRILYIYL